MSNKSESKIIHRPFGDRHPYDFSTDERTPREPFNNESAEIKYLTSPPNQVTKTNLNYWINDHVGDPTRLAGTFVGTQSDDIAFTEDGHLSEAAARAGLILGVDNWKALIPQYPPGTKIFYQIIGRNGDESTKSEVFNYTVKKIVQLNQINTIIEFDNKLIINLINEKENQAGFIAIENEKNSSYKLSCGYGEYNNNNNQKPLISNLINIQEEIYNLGSLVIKINQSPLRLDFNILDKNIFDSIESLALIFGERSKPDSIKLSFTSPENESFYGFGERYNSLNQRGKIIDVRVFEQYKNQGIRTYLPMPLFISSLGYGVFLDSLRYSVFDLAKTNNNQYSIKAELGNQSSINIQIIPGKPDNLLEIISRLNSFTGRPALPPDWAFGLWMSSNEWNTQARVEEVIEKSEQLGIQNSVIVLEAWSDENTFYIWNDAKYKDIPGSERFRYDDFQFEKGGIWPNPKEMIEKIHNKGMKILLWQIPAMKKNDKEHIQLGRDTEYMLQEKYSVYEDHQRPYKIRPFWFRDGLLMDFTNPKGSEWWMEKRRYLLEDLDIDGFKTDGGEHIWGKDLVFSDGRRSDEVWNEYPNLYAGEYYKYSKKINPEAITFSRSGYSGAQVFPCHWAGDENSTWDAFRRSIIAGLNAGISGVPFWGWDFAGFSGEIPSAELYLRAAAMATFSPIMQYHSEFNHHKTPSNDRTPWNIAERTGNDQVIPIFKSFLEIRKSLMPYILQMAKKSSKKGIPMMRAMQISFPNIDELEKYPYQYMFGDSYLIAPIIEPNIKNVKVYLPKGNWKSIWDDLSIVGGKSYLIPTSLDTIPVFKKI